MTEIQLDDKLFSLFLQEAIILSKIKFLAEEINLKLEGQIWDILVIMEGAKVFADALIPNLKFKYKLHYLQVKSYKGLHSTGDFYYDPNFLEQFEHKKLIILEDIVDSGNTLNQLLKGLNSYNPELLVLVSLLYKPSQLKHPLVLDYTGFSIGPEFIVGFGMDYKELGRELRDIYHLKCG